MSNLNVRYIIYENWQQVNQAMKNGKIDVIPNMGINEIRRNYMDFTRPVESFDIVIFLRKTTTAVNGIDDLAGKKVGVVTTNKGHAPLKGRKVIGLTHQCYKREFHLNLSKDRSR